MRALPAAALVFTWFLGALAAGLSLVHHHWETMDVTTYPTGPELRRAAAAAVLRRNDDPLLPAILEAASRAVAEGAYECRLELVAEDGSELPPPRRMRIFLALDALQIRVHWVRGPGEECRRVELAW